MYQSSFLLILWVFDYKTENWYFMNFLHLIGFTWMLAKSINFTVFPPVAMLVQCRHFNFFHR